MSDATPDEISPTQGDLAITTHILAQNDDDSPSPNAQQIEATMLEVHPPHHAISGWRDFLIHILTIVIGLLIAIGLEQTVEWSHHRSEIAEIRSALDHERRANARISGILLEEFRRITPVLQSDRAVFLYLRDHPGAPRREWPGQISWKSLSISYLNSAWKTAQSSGVLQLMPHDEVRRDTELYSRLSGGDDTYDKFLEALEGAKRYTFIDSDPSRLSHAQIEGELVKVGELLAAHAVRGRTLAAIATRFPDFKGPRPEEIQKLSASLGTQEQTTEIRGLFDRVQAIKDDARCRRCE